MSDPIDDRYEELRAMKLAELEQSRARERLRQKCVTQLLGVLQLNPDQGAPFKVTRVVDSLISLFENIAAAREGEKP